MNESNEVPTYQPPEGVHGPTLGRDLPDGCERLPTTRPPGSRTWLRGSPPGAGMDALYWWRERPLRTGDKVQLTGTVVVVSSSCGDAQVTLDGVTVWGVRVPLSALTRVVES